MKKLFILLLSLASLNLSAQDYISVELGSGLHGLSQNLKDYGNKTNNIGFQANIKYSHYFSNNWGVGVGGMFINTVSNDKLNYLREIDDAIDEKNLKFTHRTYYNDLKEKQTIYQIGVPVEILYQKQLSDKLGLNFGLGFMPEFTLSNKFKTNSGNLETKYYIPELRAEIEGIEKHNQYSKSEMSGKYDGEVVYSGIFDVTLNYQINNNFDILFGVYSSYGFNSINKTSDNLQYNPDWQGKFENPVYNGVLNSEISKGAKPFAVGVQVGVRYCLNHKNIENLDDPKSELEILEVENADTISTDNATLDSNAQPIQDTIKVYLVDTIQVYSTPENSNKLHLFEEQLTQQIYDGEEEIVPNKKYLFPYLNFDIYKTSLEITPEIEKSFNSVVKYARKHPEQKLMIYGHTCDIGTLEGNKQSGIKRAEFVKHELFKRGIPFTQMETDTKWYTEPLVSNTTDFNRKINRRVEFCFIK